MVASTGTLNPSYQDTLPEAISRRTTVVVEDRPPLTEKDVRIHAWINDRLAAIHRERHSLRAKVSWLIFGEGSN